MKSVKAPELFRKTSFQIKVNKSGRCHNLQPGQVPWGNFCCDCSCWGLIFMLFSYFVYIVHFTKFTHGSSLFMEKSLLQKNQKQKKVLGKKKNKKQAQTEKERVPLYQLKKKFLYENDLYQQSFTLMSRFHQRSHC